MTKLTIRLLARKQKCSQPVKASSTNKSGKKSWNFRKSDFNWDSFGFPPESHWVRRFFLSKQFSFSSAYFQGLRALAYQGFFIFSYLFSWVERFFHWSSLSFFFHRLLLQFWRLFYPKINKHYINLPLSLFKVTS